MTQVSVIIPTYNRLQFLKEALQSVQGQTRRPDEVIVIDDGSTDGTWEWLQSLNQKNLRTFQQLNQGPGPARNFGVAQALGKWVAFLDSDDTWMPEKLALQLDYLENNPEYKICQTEEIWIRNGTRVNSRKKHQKHSGWIFEDCLPLCIISPSAVLLDRAFFLNLGGFDPEFPVCEDYELWLRATLQSQVKTLSQRLVMKQGGHPDQLSRKHWGMDRFRVQAMEKTLRTQKLTESQLKALLAQLKIKLSILSLGFSKRNPRETNPYQERLTWLQKNPPAGSMAEPPGN